MARIDTAAAIRIRTGLLVRLDIGPCSSQSSKQPRIECPRGQAAAGWRDGPDLTATKPLRFARPMDKFKLEPIRIGKEHGWSDCGGQRRLLMRRAPGDLGGAAGKSPGAQARGIGGDPRLRGELNSSFPQPPSSPSLRPASFQSGNSLSNSHADGLNGGQKNMSSQQGNAVQYLAQRLGHRDHAVTTRRDRTFIRGRIVREVDGVVTKTARYMPKADPALVVVLVPAKPLIQREP